MKAVFLGGQNKEGSNAAQGEMRFSKTAMREIQPGCISEPHCKLRGFLHGNKAYFHLLMNISKNAIRVRALDNGELSKEKQLFLKQLLASAAAENAKKLNMLHGCSTSSVLLSWATFLH